MERTPRTFSITRKLKINKHNNAQEQRTNDAGIPLEEFLESPVRYKTAMCKRIENGISCRFKNACGAYSVQPSVQRCASGSL